MTEERLVLKQKENPLGKQRVEFFGAEEGRNQALSAKSPSGSRRT